MRPGTDAVGDRHDRAFADRAGDRLRHSQLGDRFRSLHRLRYLQIHRLSQHQHTHSDTGMAMAPRTGFEPGTQTVKRVEG
jgi:hypothetical protein